MFDAIVKSNVWDDDTVALQLLAHLEGDVLNVALLVPETQRATRSGLVGALNDHYGLPGRLADYRRKFERTVCSDGEDPSIFAIELEPLAVRAFGDMGPGARAQQDRPGSPPPTATSPAKSAEGVTLTATLPAGSAEGVTPMATHGLGGGAGAGTHGLGGGAGAGTHGLGSGAGAGTLRSNFCTQGQGQSTPPQG